MPDHVDPAGCAYLPFLLLLLLPLDANRRSQISALRFLAAQAGANCRFLVLTTKIINGRTLLDSFATVHKMHQEGLMEQLFAYSLLLNSGLSAVSRGSKQGQACGRSST